MNKHTEIDHSDAAKIEDLQAINADLLAALENAANVLAGLAMGDLKTIAKDSPALLLARAAIAKARNA